MPEKPSLLEYEGWMVWEEWRGFLKANLQVKKYSEVPRVKQSFPPERRFLRPPKCWGSFSWNIPRIRTQGLNPLAGLVIDQPMVLVSFSVDSNL